MPVWRCPHCATPQAESSRCWVCRRSTTSCGTCRHFRRGVAGGLGLCGLDPRRQALNGTEMRACWTAVPAPPDPTERRWVGGSHARVPGDAIGRGYANGSAGMTATALALGGKRPRTFVPVEELAAGASEAAVETDAASPAPVTAVPGTWWLWGDPEPWPEG